jgi:hypothetical protein
VVLANPSVLERVTSVTATARRLNRHREVHGIAAAIAEARQSCYARASSSACRAGLEQGHPTTLQDPPYESPVY